MPPTPYILLKKGKNIYKRKRGTKPKPSKQRNVEKENENNQNLRESST